ncbi:MBL fold metallo-hydrolase, partial [Paenibacillus sp. MAH-36]
MIEIKMFPASYGDSFLISCMGDIKTHIIVDMGFSSTYDKYISKELQKIKSDGVSLLIFTHIDEDHILGGIRFFNKNGYAGTTDSIDIKEIWYNSFRHLQFHKSENQASDSLHGDIKEILRKGHPRELGARKVSDIGYQQGSTLGSLILKNGYAGKWNSSFNYKAVVVSEGVSNKYFLNDEVSIILLSPNLEKLQLLGRKWEEKLSSIGYSGLIESDQLMDDAFEFYMSNLQMELNKRRVSEVSSNKETVEEIALKPFEPDTAEVNGSSIAFILEFRGKRLLFLGDCHPEVVEYNLEKLLEDTKQEKMWFDLVKVSHHGSKHNTKVSLLKLINSDKYIFSTNGKGKNFSHPDIETIYRIISTDNTRNKKLIFNYKP